MTKKIDHIFFIDHKSLMHRFFKIILMFAMLVIVKGNAYAQSLQMDTYCNPLNIDYTYMIYNANNNISYRSGAADVNDFVHEAEKIDQLYFILEGGGYFKYSK